MTFDPSQERDASGKWTSGGAFTAKGVTLKAVPSSKSKKEEDAKYFAHRAAFHAGQHFKHVQAYHAATTDLERHGHALAAEASLKRMQKNVAQSKKLAKTPEEAVHATAAQMMTDKAKALHATMGKSHSGPVAPKIEESKPIQPHTEKPSTPQKTSPIDHLSSAQKESIGAGHMTNAKVVMAKADALLKQGKHQDAKEAYQTAVEHADLAMKATATPEKTSTVYPKAMQLKKQAATAKIIASQKAEEASGSKAVFHQKSAGQPHFSHEQFHKEREEFTKKLSPGEKEALLDYSGSAYSLLNSSLRSAKGPEQLSKYHKDLQESIDSALKKSPAKEDMVVFRGMSSASVFADRKVGDVLVDHGYMSTSNEPASAFGGSVFMHITVPKGHPAAVIPSHMPQEKEILLPRGNKLMITKMDKIPLSGGGHKLVVHATIQTE